VEMILDGKLKIALSDPVYAEYSDVLLRASSLQKFKASQDEMSILLDYFAGIGKWHHIWYQLRPNLRDETDNMFVELAVTCGADFLITNNIKDFTVNPELKFDDLKIITPRDFMDLWRILNQ
ncbi:MAG: putative toxin-antitoxin system toxin component, PIN family, partial [Chloroflexota bacterium]